MSLPEPPYELLDLAIGYQRSKTLFVLIEFALPTVLSERALKGNEIAQLLKMHSQAANAFLSACVALGLLVKVGGHYKNSALADLFLVKGKPSYLGDEFLRYDRTSYPGWTDLASKLRQWKPGATDRERPKKIDQGPLGIRARHNLSRLVGHALANAYNFASHQTMLDLGGGTGAMSISICEMYSAIQSIIFDLPGVAEVANELVLENGLGERIKVISGDFKRDELPSGYDVALLANLLSVASEETNRKLLKTIYGQLPDDGVVILCGYILDDDIAGPLLPVLFCLQDISWHAPDVERDASTYSGWLADAGFVEVERKMLCFPTSMIVARKRQSRKTKSNNVASEQQVLNFH